MDKTNSTSMNMMTTSNETTSASTLDDQAATQLAPTGEGDPGAAPPLTPKGGQLDV